MHRYRFRVGFKIKPINALPKFDLMFYYAGQKEFNVPALGGHDINYSRPNVPNDIKQKTILPFNSYHILGVQLNYVFDKSAQKKKSNSQKRRR